LTSLVVFTHESLQLVSPWEQTSWQVDCEHICPVPHACPQLPQLWLSLVRSTHAPLHAVLPEGHLHVPLVHVAPAGQAWPHRPQLWTFVWRFTHAFEQLVSPLAQVVRQWPPEQTWLVRQRWPQNPSSWDRGRAPRRQPSTRCPRRDRRNAPPCSARRPGRHGRSARSCGRWSGG
jgi:hypothetical protein